MQEHKGTRTDENADHKSKREHNNMSSKDGEREYKGENRYKRTKAQKG